MARVVIQTDVEDVEVNYDSGSYLIWWPAELALDGEDMRFLDEEGSTLLVVPVTHTPGATHNTPDRTSVGRFRRKAAHCIGRR